MIFAAAIVWTAEVTEDKEENRIHYVGSSVFISSIPFPNSVPSAVQTMDPFFEKIGVSERQIHRLSTGL
jgi:hypothetical protein